MIEKKKKIDLILYSAVLKSKLKIRLFDELKLKYNDIIADAKEVGYKGLNKPNLSRYFTSTIPMSGSISQQSVLYLCIRYGVEIKLKVNIMPYDKEKCIQSIKKIF